MSQAEEKTESPSEYKLKEARKKGTVAKSADVSALLSLIGGCSVMALFLPFGIKKITAFTVLSLQGNGTVEVFLKKALDLWVVVSLPALCAACLGGFIGNVSQFGFLVSTHPLKPDVKKIDPIAGFKRLFSKNRLVDLLKQLIKFSAVFFVLYATISAFLPDIRMLFRLYIGESLAVISHMVSIVFIKVLLCFLVIAIFDWFWSRYSFLKSMRMSKYEVKKEYQQQEGDPHIKQERRRIQQETLEAASENALSQASVVITNPSHLAVAIKYDAMADETPKVLDKGMGKKAKLLIEYATSKSIPVIRNVPLVRDLAWLEINEEIPQSLYDSVAEVLLFVHELTLKNSEHNLENSQ